MSFAAPIAARIARVASQVRPQPTITTAQIAKALPKLENILRQMSNGGRPFKMTLKQFEALATKEHPKEKPVLMALAKDNFPDVNLMAIILHYGVSIDLMNAANSRGKITEKAMLDAVKRNTAFGADPRHPQQAARAMRNHAMKAVFHYIAGR